MWCRALLAAIAVTYILCVLILNGLQKEDLDVSTLRKLQRHNVNIEDVNNEALRKDCEMTNRNPSTKNAHHNTSVTLKSDPAIGDKQENEKIKLNNISDSNLHNIFKTYFSNVNPNNNDTVKKEDVEIFINVWNMMRKSNEYVVKTTTKATESSSVLVDTSISNRRSDENIEHINKILQSYIDTQTTTTDVPTTNINYDIIAQKIKDLLAKDSDTDKILQTESTREDNLRRYIVEGEFLQNGSIKSMQDKTNQYKTRNQKANFVEINDENRTEKTFLLDNARPANMRATKEDPRYKSNANKEMNSLSEDIIRELSESVRAKVLQDLKKIITTTSTKKATPTTKYTTVRETTTYTPTEITEKVDSKHENKENAATDVLEKFIEMFQQFKTNKEIPTTVNIIAEDKNIRTADKTPSTVNINVIKPIPVNITSVIINPYNPIHAPVIQTAVIPNQPYNLLNIQNMAPANLDHKITQLNIYNTRNIHAPPITIQTNSVEVPPLGFPAQQSFVYQNIVVTTKHPYKKVRFNNPYKSHAKEYEHIKFDRDRNMEYPRSSRVHYYTEFGIAKNEKSREINERYSNEKHKPKPIKYKDYGRSYSNDHNIERFHEKLERADDWPRTSKDRFISRESRNIDDDNSKPKLISRHQLPLNGAQKRSRYDDAHFKNFLKTQQKVNDMLERILATKTNGNGPRSVETTVT